MKIQPINHVAAGSWSRDCELLHLYANSGLHIFFFRNDTNTYWHLICETLVAYKVTTEELSTTGYLIHLPIEGAFFEIINSPWIEEFGNQVDKRLFNNSKHFVLLFYEQTVEVLSQKISFYQLTEKPSVLFRNIDDSSLQIDGGP